MPGFLDKIKSGADKAAFEADRLRRQAQAQGALGKLKNDLNAHVAGIGQQVVALYDGGALTQPELLALCQPMDALRQQIAAQEAEIERIRQEKPAETPAPSSPPAPVPTVAAQPPAEGTPTAGKFCPNCGTAIVGAARFCPECGQAVA